jgi:DHHC palmitoyltransferase
MNSHNNINNVSEVYDVNIDEELALTALSSPEDQRSSTAFSHGDGNNIESTGKSTPQQQIPRRESDASNREEKSKVETFEIETEHAIPSIMAVPSVDESIDEDVVEMESLLGSSKKKGGAGTEANSGQEKAVISNNNNAPSESKEIAQPTLLQFCHSCLPCCPSTTNRTITKPYRMGNIRVVYPPLYIYTGGCGVLGPHWFGPPCVIGMILLASYYIIYERCYRRHWYMTAATCTVMFLSTLYNLILAAYRDPGVIVPNSLALTEPIPRSYRWCDTCNYYQPPHAAHCPDCNVCVAGFDHHCVWMSICIGVGNFKVLYSRVIL